MQKGFAVLGTLAVILSDRIDSLAQLIIYSLCCVGAGETRYLRDRGSDRNKCHGAQGRRMVSWDSMEEGYPYPDVRRFPEKE